MSPPALVLGAAAAVLGLVFVRRAFGLGPSGLVGGGLGWILAGWRSLRHALEQRAEGVLPGRGALVARLSAPVVVAATGLGWILAGWPGVVGLAAVVCVTATVVERVLERRQARELGREVPQLCERVAASVRSGRSLRAAIARAAQESTGPGARELVHIQRDLDLGARLDSALRGACERARVPELRALSATIEVQQRAGGSLAAALDTLAARLREEDRLRADMRAATAQARASAWLVAGLPIAGGIAFELAAPGSVTALLDHSLGVAVVGVAVIFYAAGIAAISHLARGPR